MTMLSFRIEAEDASAIQRWADAAGTDRSTILRDAVRHHLALLASQHDIEAWQSTPLTADEQTLSDAADWGPAEDWEDWSDAPG